MHLKKEEEATFAAIARVAAGEDGNNILFPRALSAIGPCTCGG